MRAEDMMNAVAARPAFPHEAAARAWEQAFTTREQASAALDRAKHEYDEACMAEEAAWSDLRAIARPPEKLAPVVPTYQAQRRSP